MPRILLAALMLVAIPCFAQKSSDEAFDYYDKGYSLYLDKAYDSAIVYFTKVVQYAETHPQDSSLAVVQSYYLLGLSYEETMQLMPAHLYLQKTLELARRFRFQSVEDDAITAVNELHRQIVKNNWPFNYTPAATTITEWIYYPIEKVEPYGTDSLRLTVLGGSNDGITDTLSNPEIYSVYHQGNEATMFDIIDLGITTRIAPNRTTVIMAKPNYYQIQPGDVVYLPTEVPVEVTQSAFYPYLLKSVYLTNNYKEHIYDRGYFFHYYDSLTDKSAFHCFKKDIDEIVETFGKDSLLVNTHVKEGLFTGQTLGAALKNSTDEHLQLYLNYTLAYPEYYIGNNLTFANTYAQWLITAAPLTANDITAYLLLRKDSSNCMQEMQKLQAQVLTLDMQKTWVDKGIQYAYAEDTRNAARYAQLLQIAAAALSNPQSAAWAHYINGIAKYKIADIKAADSLLNMALKEFARTKNEEGTMWTQSSLQMIKKNGGVSLYVQSGHLAPYKIAMSPNPRFFATGSDDQLIKIWDIFQVKEVKTITAHNDKIYALNYSKDGRYLLSTSRDKTLKIWNAYDYTLLRTIKTPQPQIAAAFSRDGKYIATGGRDTLLYIWEVASGKLLHTWRKHKGIITSIAFDPNNPTTIVSSATDSMVYQYNYLTGENLGWFKEPAYVLTVKFSGDGKYMSTTCTDTMLRVWNYANKKVSFSYKVGFKKGYFAEEDYSPDGRYLVFPARNNKMRVIDLKKMWMHDYDIDGYSFLESVHFSGSGDFLIQKYEVGGINGIVNFTDIDIKNNSAKLNIKNVKLYTNPPGTIQFSQNNKALYVGTNQIGEVDLSTGKYRELGVAGQVGLGESYMVLNDSLGINMYWKKGSIYVYNYVLDEPVFGMPLKAGLISAYCMDGTLQHAYLGSTLGEIAAWDLNTRQQLFSINTGYEEVKLMKVDTFRNLLCATVNDSCILFIDALTGKVKDSLTSSNIFDIAYTPQYYYVTTNGALLKYNAAGLKQVKRIDINKEDWAGLAKMAGNYKKLALQISPTDVCVVDLTTDKMLYSFYDHAYGTAGLDISPNGQMLATGGWDNCVNLYSLATGKRIATIFTPLNEDPVISDSTGHYMASKTSLDGIVFNYNNNAYGFEQFDLQFNRPDLVLQQLGLADKTLTQTYHQAFLKRLQKLGLSEAQFSTDLHLPQITIGNKLGIKTTTKLADYELELSCFDSKYKLASLQVLVNGNPFFSNGGLSLAALNSNTVTKKINIPLSVGNNQIKVYCTNQKGASSLKESFEIFSNYKPAQEPKTYFIGIAVADYKDSSMALKYSAKDVRDLTATFSNIYPGLIIDTLIDSKATRENILALKTRLKNTTVNDKIIMAVTGHGLLSDSLDFYYATYDVDFKKPELKGLKYELLEGLLDDVPARQKLIMIDACHSGALDKETLLAAREEKKSVQKEEDGAVNLYAARGASVSNINVQPHANEVFELMQKQFADLSGNNGTVVISAAGGMEFAFESATWNNGVFTYCVRKGLEDKKADSGEYDGSITIQELQSYVSGQVTQLTHNMQQPTSRRENMEYDWKIR